MARWKGFKQKSERCYYCRRTVEDIRSQGIYMTVDHVKPKSKGGTNDWENLVSACERCNNMKSDSLMWYEGCVAIEAFGNPEWFRDMLLAEEDPPKGGLDKGKKLNECDNYIPGERCFCVERCQRKWRYDGWNSSPYDNGQGKG